MPLHHYQWKIILNCFSVLNEYKAIFSETNTKIIYLPKYAFCNFHLKCPYFIRTFKDFIIKSKEDCYVDRIIGDILEFNINLF